MIVGTYNLTKNEYDFSNYQTVMLKSGEKWPPKEVDESSSEEEESTEEESSEEEKLPEVERVEEDKMITSDETDNTQESDEFFEKKKDQTEPSNIWH